MDPITGIKEFAKRLCDGQLSMASYKPEPGARVSWCFENVRAKVASDKGCSLYGWQFGYRDAPSLGPYLVAIHHAVWLAPDFNLVDVTPFHADARLRPILGAGDSPIFLVDEAAEPQRVGHAICPLPSRFFPLADTPALRDYMDELDRTEHKAVRALIETARKLEI